MVVADLYSVAGLYSALAYPLVDLASAAVDFDLDFAGSAAGLSTSSEPKLNYNVFHHPSDYYAMTVCMLLPPLHNPFATEKSLPYYDKSEPIHPCSFPFSWQQHIVP